MRLGKIKIKTKVEAEPQKFEFGWKSAKFNFVDYTVETKTEQTTLRIRNVYIIMYTQRKPKRVRRV